MAGPEMPEGFLFANAIILMVTASILRKFAFHDDTDHYDKNL